MATKATDPNVPMGPTPAAEGVDHNGLVVGKWKSPLFGCYQTCVPNAFMSFVCPGISVAQICARLGIANYYVVFMGHVLTYLLVIIAVATNIDVEMTLMAIAIILAVLFTIRVRYRMRYLFSIPGSILEDMFTSIFCSCCAIAQMAAHAESFEVGTCAITPRATLQGYTF